MRRNETQTHVNEIQYPQKSSVRQGPNIHNLYCFTMILCSFPSHWYWRCLSWNRTSTTLAAPILHREEQSLVCNLIFCNEYLMALHWRWTDVHWMCFDCHLCLIVCVPILHSCSIIVYCCSMNVYWVFIDFVLMCNDSGCQYKVCCEIWTSGRACEAGCWSRLAICLHLGLTLGPSSTCN